MLQPTIFNTSQICHQLGVKHAVMSPGSRNAPLTISFARHEKVKKYIIPDERSAGFIALGIAQKTKEPVVLCCTSGTALLNYYPAIAEAFYREIPLIVLSADRPLNLIDQRDGQTIRQFEALKNHVKASYQLPLVQNDLSEVTYKEKLIEGLKLSQMLPKGPIHFNLPFDEPFYPDQDQILTFSTLESEEKHLKEASSLTLDVKSYQRILILVGQNDVDEELSSKLKILSEIIPVIVSPLSNLQVHGINHVDGFIADQMELQPDLLVTAGLSVLSKKLKGFLRKFKPNKHIHFDPSGVAVDTYESEPQLVKSSLSDALNQLDFSSAHSSYLAYWKTYSIKTKEALIKWNVNNQFSESSAFQLLNQFLPRNSHLHLGNSMPVRYSDLFAVKEEITVWSNRGTSGIDGCSSTAIGTSFVTENINVLLTGDVSFLYDRNAFFHNYKLPNLRVIIFNNQGGGIFRLIDGPANLPELEDYFETRHNRTAEYICLENEMEYFHVNSFEGIEEVMSHFYNNSDHAKILEVFTEPEINQREYKKLKQYIHEYINH